MKAIVTKFHGPGNVRGARISASDMDGNKVIVPYSHASTNPHMLAAEALCRRMGWEGQLVQGSIKGGDVFVFAEGPRKGAVQQRVKVPR